jgi:hypothetical protein
MPLQYKGTVVLLGQAYLTTSAITATLSSSWQHHHQFWNFVLFFLFFTL